MAKLTDTQLIILSKSARREDGAAEVPERMNKAAAAKVGASLMVRRLMPPYRHLRRATGRSKARSLRRRPLAKARTEAAKAGVRSISDFLCCIVTP
jgi:hypothetical protein